jgi:hypothetical protein
MKPPHPSEVILNGRLRTRGSPLAQRMLAEFKACKQSEQIEFLFWVMQDLLAGQERIERAMEALRQSLQGGVPRL